MEILGLVDVPTWLVLLVTCVVLLHIYGTWNHNILSSQGIPGPKPWPFVGNLPEVLTQGQFRVYTDLEKKYGKAYSLVVWSPMLVVTDLDMLKEIMVKQFPKFSDRNAPYFLRGKLFDKSVFFLEGASWKRIRSLMTPSFSSSKLKLMSHFVDRCCKLLTKNIEQHVQENKDIDVKEVFGAFSMNVIAGTAFGLETNSQTEKEEPFVTHVKKVFVNVQRSKLIDFFTYFAVMFPFLGGWVRWLRSQTNKGHVQFFIKAIEDMIDAHQADSEERDKRKTNMIQMLVDAEADPENITDNPDTSDSTKSHRCMTKEEITAQGATVFFAGYETTATTLQYLAYNLALNPDVQEKFYQEIVEHIGQEEPTYEKVATLKYLDAIIQETLRLFPVVATVNRMTRETTTVNGVVIPKGCGVIIPIYTIMHNPENFHDPEVFNPERFLGENREKLETLLLDLPFGTGPRQCLGMRLALLQLRFAAISICRVFRFLKCKDTPEKIALGKSLNLAVPDATIKVKAELRAALDHKLLS